MNPSPETDVRLEARSEAAPDARPVERPTFHVALLGDFSGRGVPGTGARDPLEAVAVDRDDLDDVLAGFAPRLRFGEPVSENGLEVTFRELDDFHPDVLVDRVPLFRSLREAAGRGAVGGDRPASGRSSRPLAGTSSRPAPVEEMLSGSVLDRIVEGQERPGETEPGEGGTDRPRRRGSDPLETWVEDIVRPHLETPPDPEDARVAERVEALVADGMRELLRDRRFRRLEALWRGVDFLVRRVETGGGLTLHLVDVTAGELAAGGGEAALTDLLRRGAGPEGEPWSLVAAAWTVGSDPDELVLLRGLARRASVGGAVFLAGGAPALAGLASLEHAGDRGAWGDPDRLWSAFRREPEARSVGLALPRFLLRLPYGGETDPCDRLDLEEIPGMPDQDDYVWGPAAFPVVLMLARAFRAGGRDLLDAFDPHVGELPLHVHHGDGEARATPCTEVALTRDDADRLLDAGLMPFAWSRGGDTVRLLRLQSAADPPAGLAGWWR